LLIAKELFGHCDGSMEEPATGETAKKAFKLNAQKAHSQIVLSVSDEFIYLITECETAQQAWEKLQSHFERDTLANRIYLKKQYFRAVMKSNDSVENYLKYMKDIVNKLRAIKAPVNEENQVVTFLGSMPSEYQTVVTKLEAQKPETLTLEFVQNALFNEEQKKKVQQALNSASINCSGKALENTCSEFVIHYNVWVYLFKVTSPGLSQLYRVYYSQKIQQIKLLH